MIVLAEKVSAKALRDLRQRAIDARREKKRRIAALENPGRRVGSVAGSYMADICAVRQCVMLCQHCRHKFDAARHHYRQDKRFRVNGKCDGCRSSVWDGRLSFFVHETHAHF